MTKIWDLNSKFGYYLQVELAVCDAYAKLGTIPSEAAKEIREKASFSVERIDEIEREVRHDVIAFLTCVNESLGDLGRYVHVGLTSSDVIDTAFALQIQDSGKIIKADVSIAKNYLSDEEMSYMERIVSLYLDYAELQAERQIPMSMEDWAKRLDGFLEFNGNEILTGAGKISAEQAKLHAETEFEKYRIIQDQLYESDFDRFLAMGQSVVLDEDKSSIQE